MADSLPLISQAHEQSWIGSGPEPASIRDDTITSPQYQFVCLTDSESSFGWKQKRNSLKYFIELDISMMKDQSRRKWKSTSSFGLSSTNVVPVLLTVQIGRRGNPSHRQAFTKKWLIESYSQFAWNKALYYYKFHNLGIITLRIKIAYYLFLYSSLSFLHPSPDTCLSLCLSTWFHSVLQNVLFHPTPDEQINQKAYQVLSFTIKWGGLILVTHYPCCCIYLWPAFTSLLLIHWIDIALVKKVDTPADV